MKKLLDSLVKVETVLASVILAALILCTFSGVLARYCFSAPFTWEEEFQLACMVWITFLAAPVAFHTKSHVAIEILVDAFPKKVQRVMEICIFILMYAILIYFFFPEPGFHRGHRRHQPENSYFEDPLCLYLWCRSSLHRTHAHQLYLYDCGPYIPWQSYQKRSRGGRINEYPCACHGSCAPVPPIL